MSEFGFLEWCEPSERLFSDRETRDKDSSRMTLDLRVVLSSGGGANASLASFGNTCLLISRSLSSDSSSLIISVTIGDIFAVFILGLRLFRGGLGFSKCVRVLVSSTPKSSILTVSLELTSARKKEDDL